MPNRSVVRSLKESQSLNWSRARAQEFNDAFGVDKDRGCFWGNLDELEYRSLSQLVEKSLEAHGYEPNLENILCGLETLRLGRRVEPKSDHQASDIKRYQKVISFEFPKKGRSGPVLNQLYALIDALQSGEVKGGGLRNSRDDAREKDLEKDKKIDELQLENQQLRLLLQDLRAERASRGVAEDLRQQMENVHVEQKHAHGLGSYQVATGQVSEIRRKSLTVTFKFDKGTLDLHFKKLLAFPEQDAWGVALLKEGQIEALLPMGERWASLCYEPAEVLAATPYQLKVRLPSGQEDIVALSPAPLEIRRRFRRGERIVVSVARGRCVVAYELSIHDRDLQLLELGQRLQKLHLSEEDMSESWESQAGPSSGGHLP